MAATDAETVQFDGSIKEDRWNRKQCQRKIQPDMVAPRRVGPGKPGGRMPHQLPVHRTRQTLREKASSRASAKEPANPPGEGRISRKCGEAMDGNDRHPLLQFSGGPAVRPHVEGRPTHCVVLILPRRALYPVERVHAPRPPLGRARGDLGIGDCPHRGAGSSI